MDGFIDGRIRVEIMANDEASASSGTSDGATTFVLCPSNPGSEHQCTTLVILNPQMNHFRMTTKVSGKSGLIYKPCITKTNEFHKQNKEINMKYEQECGNKSKD